MGVGDLLGAHAGDAGEGRLDAHLLGGAGNVDGHILPHLAPLQLVLQEVVDEGHGLIQRKPLTERQSSAQTNIFCSITRTEAAAVSARTVLCFEPSIEAKRHVAPFSMPVAKMQQVPK